MIDDARIVAICRPRPATAAAALLAAALLAGCGQKGPLFLPEGAVTAPAPSAGRANAPVPSVETVGDDGLPRSSSSSRTR